MNCCKSTAPDLFLVQPLSLLLSISLAMVVFSSVSLGAFSSVPEIYLNSVRLEEAFDHGGTAGEAGFDIFLEITIPEGFYQEMESPFFSLSFPAADDEALSETITFGDIESDDGRVHKGREILEGEVLIRVPVSGWLKRLETLSEKGEAEKGDTLLSLEYQLCSFDGNCYYPRTLPVSLGD